MGCSSSKTRGAEPKGEENNAQAEAQAPPTLTEETAEGRALTQLQLVFNSIDKNEDCSVSKEELEAALGKDPTLGALIKEAGFNIKFSALSELDTDKDGCVSWEEFKSNLKAAAVEEVKDKGDLAAAEMPASEKVLKQLKEIFHAIDNDENGSVDMKELQDKLNRDEDEHGLPKDGSFAKLIQEAGFNPGYGTFEELDLNHDGRITWEEFEKNIRLVQVAKKQVLDAGDVVAAMEDEAKDEGPAPRCGPCC